MTLGSYAARDGTSLGLRVGGPADGPAVLLLSGGPGCVNYLPVPPPGFPGRVVAPDPRGVGSSAGGPHDVAQALDDLEALRDSLGVVRWIVVGHSSGADLGLAYAATHPDAVAHLVSVCGTGLQDDRSWHATWEARRHEEPALDVAWDPDVHRALLDSWREWVRSPDLWDRVRAVSCDVSVVAAELDIRPSWPLAQLAVLFKTPLRVLPGVGHDVWHSDPELWWEVVAEAVAAHRSRPAPPTTDEDDARNRADRHSLLSALHAALADPHLLVDVVGGSADGQDAVIRLGDALGLSELQAQMVLDVQVRRLSRLERTQIGAALDELAP